MRAETFDSAAPALAPFDDDAVPTGLRALLWLLWRGRWLLLGGMLAGALVFGAYAFRVAVPLYKATAVVVLETRAPGVGDLQGLVAGLTGDIAEINSEIEVMRGRALAGRVVDALGLMADPEFNAALTPDPWTVRLRRTIREGLSGRGAPAVDAARQRRDAVIDALLARVSVRPVPSSYVFRITATSTAPEQAARIADAVAAAYIDGQVAAKRAIGDEAVRILSERVAALEADLLDGRGRLAALTAGTEVLSAEETAGLERQLATGRQRLADLEAEAARARALAARLGAPGGPTDLAAATGDRILLRLAPDADTPDAPSAAAFAARVAALRAEQADALARLGGQAEAQAAATADLEARLARQAEIQPVARRLTEDAEATRLLHESLLARLKEATAELGLVQPDSCLLSAAALPGVPSEPRRSFLVSTGLVLGLLAGLAATLARARLARGMLDAVATERSLGRPVLGVVPVLPIRSRGELLPYLRNRPTSRAAEAVRDLRTSLTAMPGTPPGVILIASSVPSEGKTTVAVALAQNLAALGRPVLLVEGDIRRRVLSRYGSAPPAATLVDVLRGGATPAQAVARDPNGGFDVVHGGDPGLANAADLLGSPRLAEALAAWRASHGTVILDAPPVLAVPDARIIAQVVDGVLLVVRWNATPAAQAREAIRAIEGAGGRVLGLVLGRLDERRAAGFGLGGRHGVYGRHGAAYWQD